MSFSAPDAGVEIDEQPAQRAIDPAQGLAGSPDATRRTRHAKTAAPPCNCGLVHIRRLRFKLEGSNRTPFSRRPPLFPATPGAEHEEILLAFRLCCGPRISLEPNWSLDPKQFCTEACRPRFRRSRISCRRRKTARGTTQTEWMHQEGQCGESHGQGSSRVYHHLPRQHQRDSKLAARNFYRSGSRLPCPPLRRGFRQYFHARKR
jgi:hypothetical protein